MAGKVNRESVPTIEHQTLSLLEKKIILDFFPKITHIFVIPAP